MKSSFFRHFVLFGLTLSASAAELVLRYDKPATRWEQEALPIGNGQMGAMLFGGVQREQIQFNEESLWIGDEEDTGACLLYTSPSPRD